jgi:hypothetical protein
MDLPVKWRRGFDEAYAGAEGSHIEASVVVGAVEPAWSAHTADRKMKLKSSSEIDVARAGIPGEGGASDPAPGKKLRVEEEPQNTRPLDEQGGGRRWRGRGRTGSRWRRRLGKG